MNKNGNETDQDKEGWKNEIRTDRNGLIKEQFQFWKKGPKIVQKGAIF